MSQTHRRKNKLWFLIQFRKLPYFPVSVLRPSSLTSPHLLPYLPFQKLHSLLCLVAKKFYLSRRRRIGGVEEKKERKHLKQASTSGVAVCFCLCCCFCFLVSWFSGFGSHYQIVLIVKKNIVGCELHKLYVNISIFYLGQTAAPTEGTKVIISSSKLNLNLR